MIFDKTKIHGTFIVRTELKSDERGYFARTWCNTEFRQAGLSADIAQCSVAFNARRATLRGMHLQRDPHGEHKLVRCTRGSVYDVVVDLRPESKTYCEWIGIELSADSHTMLFIPPGCAHGYVTLEDSTELAYQMSVEFHPESAMTVRWNDPAFAIEWPLAPVIMTPRDRECPDYVPAAIGTGSAR